MKKIILVILCFYISYLGADVKKIDLNLDNSFDLNTTTRNYNGKEIKRIEKNSHKVISYSETKGEPKLPWIPVNIALPNGSVFNDVKLSLNSKKTEKCLIEAIQEIVPTDNSVKSEYVYPEYSAIKGIFPTNNVKFTGINKLSKYTIFTFLVNPFSYNISTNELTEYEDISLSVDYSVGTKIGSIKKWDNGEFYAMAKNLVVNPEDLDMPIKKAFSKSDISHLIITNTALASAFEPLKNWRTAEGLTSEIITTTDIYASYTGATNQLKIKNCIKDYYENKNLKWVVIGGDDKIVPDQNTYGFVNSEPTSEDYTIPTDLFYACFDDQFDWNSNGNDKVGEPTDNVDLSPEVFIGRIPARTATDVTAYVTKMIDYEQNPPTDIVDKFLMTGCKLWDLVDGVSDGEAKSEKMWNDYIDGNWSGTKQRFYDTNTDFGGAGYDLISGNLSTVINQGFGFIHMATHGNQQIWGMEGGGYFSSNDALNLTNNKMGIVVTMACITNAFDCDETATSSNCSGGTYMNDPCLSEGFLRNPNGGSVGYLGSSRYGWGNGATAEPGVSLQYNQQFFYKLFTGEGQTAETSRRFGAISALTKISYISSSSSNGAYRWIMFTLNTMGDPALKICKDADLTCSITAPENNSIYKQGEVITIDVDAADLENKSVTSVAFYVDNNLLYEDTTSPYSYNWNTAGYNTKNYIIKALTTDNDGNNISNQISITLTPEIEIALFDNFDDSGLSWDMTNEFEIAAPTGLGGTTNENHGNADPSSAFSGNKVLGTDLTGDGNYENGLNEHQMYAISPTTDCSNHNYVLVEFQRYLNIETPNYDTATFSVWDGSTWQTVWVNTDAVSDVTWQAMSYDVSNFAANKSSVKFRFSVGPTDGGWKFSGWNIDDFKVSYDKTSSNHAPRISVINDSEVNKNQSISIPFTISDDDNDPLTLSAASSNTTLIPESNIVFSGTDENRTLTITPTTNMIGNSTISVKVDDGVSKSFAITSFNLTVKDLDQNIIVESLSYAQEVSTNNWTPQDQEIIENETLNFSITANDPDGNDLSYSWKVNDSAVATTNKYDFTTDYTSFGDYVINLIVTDNFNAKENKNTLSYSWNVTVNNLNRSPIITNFTPENTIIEITNNTLQNFSITANDPDADNLIFSWILDDRILSADNNSCSNQFENGNHILYGIASDGVLADSIKWNIESASSIIDELIPQKNELVGNYPNPFNPTTQIKFGLKENGIVNISIYNFKGQLVQNIINRNLKAGYHLVKFNGKNLTSGGYLVRMQTGNNTFTKKILLIK